MNERRLFLLDAFALIYRAYYALINAPRKRRDGFNTSAIFGFVNTLEEVLRKERPTHIAVCFDPPGPTFRNEAYEAYKSEREAQPEDITLAIPIIKEIIHAYGIRLVEVEGYEADDVIGTLAKRAAAEGFTTYMMTPDKDFGQLVGPNVLQYKPSYRGQDFEIRGEEEICRKYGLKRPEQVIDLLALMGDKIDNIPGCPGVGEKTAVKLIQEYGDVEHLLASTDTLKGALKKKIEENAQQIRDSRYLATIITDVPVEIDPEELRLGKPEREKLWAIFKDMEFNQLRQRVERRLDEAEGKMSAPVRQAQSGGMSLFSDEELDGGRGREATSELLVETEHIGLDYRAVTTQEELDRLSAELSTLKRCSIVLLADGENDMTANWIGTAVAWDEGHAAYIPSEFRLGQAWVLDLMARSDIEKVTTQAKRDYVLAARARTDKAEALSNYYDVSLAHYLLQPEMRHGIGNLSAIYLKHDIPAVPAPDLKAPRGSKGLLYSLITTDHITSWACEIADLTLRLREPLQTDVEAEGMNELLHGMELPLSRVLAEMELTGVRIDVTALDEAAGDMERRIEALEQDIHALAGEVFNVGSPAKVGEILFDKLQLDAKAKKTKTGQYSTSEDILEGVAHKHPIVSLILEWRQLKKLLTTYLTALPQNINPATGKVHTNYNQTVTATGRISSSNPNLQNIPVRDGEGREIRRAFIADEGHLFLSADYSQIELRLVADFANDAIMLDAFANNKDIHAITAAKIYHTTPEEVTADQRRHAKTANFGILYGISAFGLSSRLAIPRGEAKELIDNYFATFPTVHRYMQESIETARKQGYVSTRIGRKRRLPDINSRNQTVRGYAERNAINAPIQGSAADIIKRAMVDIADEMRRRGLRSRMIMQVHDELNFDVVPEELAEMQELVVRGMEKAYEGRVRLTASCGVATNWLDAH
ncbi:MAG: DNA polymerase I [Muribaculaceae bacterium]|nr:DNA polymerase I [Muribaculaceae bacterium]